MKQPLFPSIIGTQSRLAYFLTVKAKVTKFGKSDGQAGSWCLDKAVLAQGGGGRDVLREAGKQKRTKEHAPAHAPTAASTEGTGLRGRSSLGE